MCKWGSNTMLVVTVPASLSYTGEAREKVIGIDECIAPIVKALNAAGIETTQSCCGHGKGDGSIQLADGRELIVRSSSQTENNESHTGQ